MATQTTTLPRRLLARRLLGLRAAAGLTRDKAAELSEMSSQTLWRLENAQVTNIKKMVMRALCDTYNAADDERRTLLWLAEESRKTGWWQSYGDAMFDNEGLFVALEQAARRITSFQLALIPGIMQTAEYRRANAEIYTPPLTSDEIDRHIDLLMKRQRRLKETSDSFVIDVILSEAALRHRVGGKEVMAAQLRRVIRLSRQSNVSVRIIPLTAEGDPGPQIGTFVLLEFPQHLNRKLNEPPVVYVESYAGALYLDKPTEIEQYRAALSAIENVALDQSQSRALLTRIAEEYEA